MRAKSSCPPEGAKSGQMTIRGEPLTYLGYAWVDYVYQVIHELIV